MDQSFSRYSRKPPIGTPVDLSHPLTRGLMAFVPCWEGAGSTAVDVIGGNVLTASGGTWVPGSDQVATGLAGSNAGFACSSTKFALNQSTAWPMTIVAKIKWVSTNASGNNRVFGLYPASGSEQAIVDCYWSYSFSYGGATGLLSTHALNGSTVVSDAMHDTATPTPGKDYTIGISFTGGASGAAAFWRNGVQVFLSSVTLSNPSYTGSPGIYLGNNPNVGQTPTIDLYWFGAWNRVLTAAEHEMLAANPWRIFRPRYMALEYFTFPTASATASDRLSGHASAASAALPRPSLRLMNAQLIRWIWRREVGDVPHRFTASTAPGDVWMAIPARAAADRATDRAVDRPQTPLGRIPTGHGWTVGAQLVRCPGRS